MQNIVNLPEEITKTNAKRVLIQLPEGLKRNSTEIIAAIEKSGVEVVYSIDATYGACDIRLEEARIMKCDAIVHVGHNKFYRDIKSEIPVIYWPWELESDITGAEFSGIKENVIGIITSIQHKNMMEKVKSRIEESRKIEILDTKIFEKRRYASIFRARDAKSFAILVSTKEGQSELLRKAKRIKDYLLKNGKGACILVMDEINGEKLLGMQVDAYINTACTRITDGDFSKPMINATDVELLFPEVL